MTLATAEGAAYGAAVLASVGAGWHLRVEDATDEWVELRERTEPDPAVSYVDANRRYRELYPALKSTFHDMARP